MILVVILIFAATFGISYILMYALRGGAMVDSIGVRGNLESYDGNKVDSSWHRTFFAYAILSSVLFTIVIVYLIGMAYPGKF